jgi:tellurite methyltransferase
MTAMRDERSHWDARYGARTDRSPRPASLFLCSVLDQLPAGRALDVACGDGRNALALAERGLAVDGVDVSRIALENLRRVFRERGLDARVVQCDLENFALQKNLYDVVVNVRYLQRAAFPSLKRAVRDAGVVVFETFLREQASIGHPRNPAFLLERGELAKAFADFELLACEEGLLVTEGEPAYLARVLARRPLGWEAD